MMIIPCEFLNKAVCFSRLHWGHTISAPLFILFFHITYVVVILWLICSIDFCMTIVEFIKCILQILECDHISSHSPSNNFSSINTFWRVYFYHNPRHIILILIRSWRIITRKLFKKLKLIFQFFAINSVPNDHTCQSCRSWFFNKICNVNFADRWINLTANVLNLIFQFTC